MSYEPHLLGKNSYLVRRPNYTRFASTRKFKNPSEEPEQWRHQLPEDLNTDPYIIQNGRFTRNVRLPYEKKKLLPSSAYQHKSFLNDKNIREKREDRDPQTNGFVKPRRFLIKPDSERKIRDFTLPTERIIRNNVFSDGYPKGGSLSTRDISEKADRSQLLNFIELQENEIRNLRDRGQNDVANKLSQELDVLVRSRAPELVQLRKQDEMLNSINSLVNQLANRGEAPSDEKEELQQERRATEENISLKEEFITIFGDEEVADSIANARSNIARIFESEVLTGSMTKNLSEILSNVYDEIADKTGVLEGINNLEDQKEELFENDLNRNEFVDNTINIMDKSENPIQAFDTMVRTLNEQLISKARVLPRGEGFQPQPPSTLRPELTELIGRRNAKLFSSAALNEMSEFISNTDDIELLKPFTEEFGRFVKVSLSKIPNGKRSRYEIYAATIPISKGFVPVKSMIKKAGESPGLSAVENMIDYYETALNRGLDHIDASRFATIRSGLSLGRTPIDSLIELYINNKSESDSNLEEIFKGGK